MLSSSIFCLPLATSSSVGTLPIGIRGSADSTHNLLAASTLASSSSMLRAIVFMLL